MKILPSLSEIAFVIVLLMLPMQLLSGPAQQIAAPAGQERIPLPVAPGTPPSEPESVDLPLSFEPNVGQAAPSVRYLARGAGGAWGRGEADGLVGEPELYRQGRPVLRPRALRWRMWARVRIRSRSRSAPMRLPSLTPPPASPQ